jgi:hypothetical protein
MMGPVVVGFLFSLLVSGVFAFVERNDPKDRLRYFIKAFLYFFGSILLAGWLMSLLPL